MDIKNKILKKKIITLFLVFCVIFLYHFQYGFRLSFGWDDNFYANAHKKYNILKYLMWRYSDWSARLFPEMILYYIFHYPVVLWRLFNTFFILLASYSIIRIFKENVTRYNIIVVLLLFGYSSYEVFEWAVFWVPGAINYLWPISLGTFILIPFADNFFRHKEIKFSIINCLKLLIVLIVSISNEQLSVCIILIIFFYFFAMFYKHRCIPFYFIIVAILILSGFLFMYFAPGNKLRYEAEVQMQFPNFKELNLSTHIRVGFIWLYKVVIPALKYVFFLIAILTILIMNNLKNRNIFFILLLFIMSLTFINPDLFDFDLINSISFKSINFSIFSGIFFKAIFPYFLWSIFLILLINFSCRVSENPIFILLCYLVGLASCLLMFFSPTMYASQARVFFCFLVCLIIIVFILFKKVLEKKHKSRYFYLIILSVFPIANMLIKIYLNL